jgi:tetratricopeptide (TPR) repeat protein
MKKIVLRGAMILAVALPGLLAQPKPKSADELTALKAVFSAQGPDAHIAAAENLLTKFADTEFKSTVLFVEASAYREKGDYDHTVVFADRAIEADPKNYGALLMRASTVAQHTKEFDLDREEKLTQVDKDSKAALELLKDAPKPRADISDEKWTAAKKDLAADAHTSMGMGALLRKKYDVAESEFKLSLEEADKPDPSNIVRLGRAYAQDGKYDDAIAQFDKVMAMQDINVTVRQIAQAERVRTIQKKGGPPKPADAAPPASPAPPKPDAPKP